MAARAARTVEAAAPCSVHHADHADHAERYWRRVFEARASRNARSMRAWSVAVIGAPAPVALPPVPSAAEVAQHRAQHHAERLTANPHAPGGGGL
ncbi:MAG: hypothetical protein OXJ62_14960 [Spirochaetaceae bacterium]|nr:hypothetical protein [Spirochaetaceae bacterium]